MPIRAHLRFAAKIPALLVGPALVLGLAAGGIYLAARSDQPGYAAGFLLAGLGAATFLGYQMIHTFSWVEFDGQRVRARHLYTRRLWDHPLADVTEVRPVGAAARGHVVNRAVDHMIGPVRGYEIRLAGRRRGIWMAVGDTALAAELAAAVAAAGGKPIGYASR